VSAQSLDVRPGDRVVEDEIIELTDKDRMSFAIGCLVGDFLHVAA